MRRIASLLLSTLLVVVTPNVKYQELFLRLQLEAREARRKVERWKLWNNACVQVATGAGPLVVPASVGRSKN